MASRSLAGALERSRAFQIRRKVRMWLWAYGFLAPSLILFALIVLYPSIEAFRLSLYRWSLFGEKEFIGLANYQRMVRDPLFWQSLKVTFIWTLGVVPWVMVLGMLTALALNQPWLPGRGIFRTIYFVPVMTSVVASAFVWRWLFEPTFGVVNWILRQVGIADPPGWLASTTWALPALMTAGVWKQVGYAMVLFLAGLQTIPRELREAAEIDGANPWQVFRHVTLPLLNPTVVFVAVILVINAFRVFSIPYVMTSGGFTYLTPGGPLNSTRVFVLHIYDLAWKQFDFGYGAANAIVLLLMIMTVTLIQLRILQRPFEY
jgi:ABC-type sugar transport systems, permease components